MTSKLAEELEQHVDDLLLDQVKVYVNLSMQVIIFSITLLLGVRSLFTKGVTSITSSCLVLIKSESEQ